MKAPVGLLSDRTVLRQQDGGASPRQVQVYHKESRYKTSRASTCRWRLCSFHICGFAQEMASTSHFIWTASAPSSAMWSAPALSMACSGVRAPHNTCRPGIIRAVRAMTSCALVQWYFSQRSPSCPAGGWPVPGGQAGSRGSCSGCCPRDRWCPSSPCR